jgi:hypothetical protein
MLLNSSIEPISQFQVNISVEKFKDPAQIFSINLESSRGKGGVEGDHDGLEQRTSIRNLWLVATD